MEVIGIEQKGLTKSMSVIVAVIVSAIVVGSAVYILAPSGGGGAEKGGGQIDQKSVEEFLRTTSKSKVQTIVGESVSQDVISKVATGPRDITFGCIYPFSIGGESWNMAWKEGIDMIDNKYPNVDYVQQAGVEEGQVATVAESMINEDGADILWGAIPIWGRHLKEINNDYPNKLFAYSIQSKTDNAFNVRRFYAKYRQALFLTGMVAGYLTETDDIGMVGAYRIPEVSARVNTFTLGVRKANPDATVHMLWADSWYDPATESEIAKTLVDQYNCDVLSKQTDSPAPAGVAEEKGVWLIGKDSDPAEEGWASPETVATSHTYNLEAVFDILLKDYLAGGPEEGKRVFFPGMDDGSEFEINGEKKYVAPVDMTFMDGVGVPEGISPSAREELTEEQMANIKNYRQMMLEGTWSPWRQKVTAQGITEDFSEGEVITPKGSVPSTLWLKTNYFYVPGVDTSP